MSITNRHEQRQLGRKIEGMAACLLPFEENGEIAEQAFRDAVARTEAAGLTCAVNMDTGYANYLTEQERLEVLGSAGGVGGRDPGDVTRCGCRGGHGISSPGRVTSIESDRAPDEWQE